MGEVASTLCSPSRDTYCLETVELKPPVSDNLYSRKYHLLHEPYAYTPALQQFPPCLTFPRESRRFPTHLCQFSVDKTLLTNYTTAGLCDKTSSACPSLAGPSRWVALGQRW